MDLTWSTAAQAVIVAACTWYMRRGSKRDAESVKRATAAQSTSNEILARIVRLEDDVALIKQVTLKDRGIDHRGPAKGKSQ